MYEIGLQAESQPFLLKY